MNPVLARETKERFRGKRVTPWLLITWIGAIGLIGYLLYLLARVTAEQSFGLGRAVAAGFMGRFLFESMTILLVTAVVMVVPGITALAIVGERERQTFHLLQVTQMSPFQLITGKLSASIVYFLLLIVAVLPIAGLPLLFGGTGLKDVVVAVAFILLLTVMLASTSMWMSARSKSSRGAVALSYVIAFSIAFFSFAGLGAEYFLALDEFNDIPRGGIESYSGLVNPYLGLVSAMEMPLEVDQQRVFATPYTALELHLFQRQGANLGGFGGQVAPGTIRIEDGRQFVNYSRPPLWIYTVSAYVLLTVVALYRATRLVQVPAPKPIRVKSRKDRDPEEKVPDATS